MFKLVITWLQIVLINKLLGEERVQHQGESILSLWTLMNAQARLLIDDDSV